MKEIPILFSTPMVQAILEDRKFMTRRVIKPQPLWVADPSTPFKTPDADPKGIIKCPYGQPGDRLWVRETWCKNYYHEYGNHYYRADGETIQVPLTTGGTTEFGIADGLHWKPSIHMPKIAARIWLEVVSVRVERLQDITEEDARLEGVDFCCPSQRHAGWNDRWIAGNCHDCKHHDPMTGKCPKCFGEETRFQWSCGCNYGFELRDDSIPEPYRFKFSFVWDDIVHKGKGGPVFWGSNPMVWVVGFRRSE